MRSRCRSILKGVFFFLFPLLFCLIVAVPVWAATWYVSPLGDDANVGSDPAVPLKTVGAAVGKAMNGDEIRVAQGQYAENVSIQNLSDLTLTGGWSSDFSTQDPAAYESVLVGDSTTAVVHFIACRRSRISGFIIQGGNRGLYVEDDQSVELTLRVDNCTITGATGYGIYFRGAYVVIDHSRIVNNGSSGIAGHGPYTITRGDMLNNTITGNGAGGIYIISNKRWKIFNNVVANNYGGGVWASYPGMWAMVYNNTIVYNDGGGVGTGYYGMMHCVNNIIAFNGDYGFNNVQNNYIRNEYNDVYGNTNGDYLNVTPSPTDLNVDPDMDATYHLNPASPLINAGMDLSGWFSDDIDDQPRSVAVWGDGQYDIGADESVIDVDQDGWIELWDCDDADPAIHPDAVEVKHDGVDQDCNGYDLTIDITKAQYESKKDVLRVEATSSLAGAAQLILFDEHMMTYKTNQDRWDITLDPAGGNPGTVWVCGIEGCESALVKVE